MKLATRLLFLFLISTLLTPVHAQSRRAIGHAKSQEPTSQRTGKFESRASANNELKSSLPIRRVILYSNGVAYIERRGLVRNHAEVSFSFKQSQVDDVLKSMVVIDLGRGRIGAVSYNSSEPAATRLNEIPFSISASTDGNNGGGLAGVLSQLQGARVIVTTANRTVVGSVLTVEVQHSQIDSDKRPITSHRLVIASDGGALAAFDLSEVRSVQLADEGSRRDLSEFAHAVSSARRRDAKTIVVTSDGNGERELMVSYTIAAPIWKTTYRVVLDNAGKPFFQGWAIVDNVGEEDWNDIELSLVSGTPISFIQPIQNPVYRYRPVIPLQDDLNLRPQTYEPAEEGSGGRGSLRGKVTDPAGAVVPGVSITLTNDETAQSFQLTTNDQGEYQIQGIPTGTYKLAASRAGFKDLRATELKIRSGLRSKFDLGLEPGNVTETVTVTAGDEIDSRSIENLPIQGRGLSLLGLSAGVVRGSHKESIGSLLSNNQSGVIADTTASDIGDLFEYHIDQPVTVPRDRSALIPILQTHMEGGRVSIYRGSGNDDDDDNTKTGSRPMGGMLLKNTSALTLEDGSLTVIDGNAYAGESLLERLKPGEERLISFALDLGTFVNEHSDGNERQPTHWVRVVNGVFEAHYFDTRTKIYTLVNQTDKPRVVYIEHPRAEDDNWELVSSGNSGKPAATTVSSQSAASVADDDDDDKTTASLTKTAKYYRFRIELKPHEKLEFPVVERNQGYDSYQLTSLTRPQLQVFVARHYLDENTRKALEGIVALKEQLAGIDARLAAIAKEVNEISQDQTRLRDNIKALTSTAEAKQLIMRYVAKADEQESRLDQLEKDRRAAAEERARIESQLETAIRSLSFDRRLQ